MRKKLMGTLLAVALVATSLSFGGEQSSLIVTAATASGNNTTVTSSSNNTTASGNNTASTASNSSKNDATTSESNKSNTSQTATSPAATNTSASTASVDVNLNEDVKAKLGANPTVTAVPSNSTYANATVEITLPASSELKAIPSGYKNAVPLDISLFLAGTAQSGVLKDNSKITITMPVPNGLDINKIAVLHYYEGAFHEEAVTKNSDGTITFAVNRFSLFAFVEKEATGGSQNTNNANTGSNASSVAAPKTGDTTANVLPLTVAGILLVVSALVVKKKRA